MEHRDKSILIALFSPMAYQHSDVENNFMIFETKKSASIKKIYIDYLTISDGKAKQVDHRRNISFNIQACQQ